MNANSKLSFAPNGDWGRALCVLALAVWLAACSDPKQKQVESLERSVEQVARVLGDASRNPTAAAALQSNLEGGGTLLSYLAASLPDNFTTRITAGKPAVAWSIAVRDGQGQYDVIVEGYGDDLGQPLMTRNAKTGPPPMPK